MSWCFAPCRAGRVARPSDAPEYDSARRFIGTLDWQAASGAASDGSQLIGDVRVFDQPSSFRLELPASAGRLRDNTPVEVSCASDLCQPTVANRCDNGQLKELAWQTVSGYNAVEVVRCLLMFSNRHPRHMSLKLKQKGANRVRRCCRGWGVVHWVGILSTLARVSDLTSTVVTHNASSVLHPTKSTPQVAKACRHCPAALWSLPTRAQVEEEVPVVDVLRV
jgi:hypothetical protein